MNRRLQVAAFISLIALTGCATPDWARSDDWIKKQHWELGSSFQRNPYLNEWPGVNGYSNSDEWARNRQHW